MRKFESFKIKTVYKYLDCLAKKQRINMSDIELCTKESYSSVVALTKVLEKAKCVTVEATKDEGNYVKLTEDGESLLNIMDLIIKRGGRKNEHKR